MLLKLWCSPLRHAANPGFSTLYRVDAIEARHGQCGTDFDRGFSTLYRVDAIEAARPLMLRSRVSPVSVPSIGSMLLKLASIRLLRCA